jgi:MoaE-MoaD fusion protein
VTGEAVAPLRVRIRLFAVQRELAGTRELTVDLAAGSTVEDAWEAVVVRYPVLAPGRASVRFALNGTYADAADTLGEGDEVAMIPPVSGGAGPAGDEPGGSILELRAEPFDAGILAELTARLATPDDGAVVGFLGITRVTPGTPAPGQEDEALRHAGERVEGLDYEALEPMALRILADVATEVRDRFGVTRLAIVHRTGAVPLAEPSVAIVAVAPHRAAAFDAARYAIDETKARAPIWKAERFASGHVWTGAPARTAAEGQDTEER